MTTETLRALAELEEKLAELAHEQWSGWMIYLFGKSSNDGDGNCVIPKEWANRWGRQAGTKYAGLSDEEKESDRIEARKVLALIRIAELGLTVEAGEEGWPLVLTPDEVSNTLVALGYAEGRKAGMRSHQSVIDKLEALSSPPPLVAGDTQP